MIFKFYDRNTIKDLKEKTKDLDDYHRIKNVA